MENKYEVGDIVTTKSGYQSRSFSKNYGGGGYIEDYTFKIHKAESTNFENGKYGNQLIWDNKGNGMYSNALRKATIDEVEQYVKDNNCSIDEILEICKRLYPIGTEYRSAGNISLIYRLKEEIKKNEDYVFESYGGYIYKNGKFARIIQEVDTKEELPFKVGDKVLILESGWGCLKQDKPATIIELMETVLYGDTLDVRVRLYDGLEIIVPTTSKGRKVIEIYNGITQLKKEDFYNTKIDVSESRELSKAVQEKLFELGFKWNVSGKEIIEHSQFIFIHDNKILTYAGTLSYHDSYKQIYPQDLGININNKKQIQNDNKENNKGSAIKVQRPIATISKGERRTGNCISGRRNRTAISLGHLSNKTVNSF